MPIPKIICCILPKVAVQEKNAILGGTFGCHTIFQERIEEGDKE